jgi:hypothetical protein
MRAKRIYVESSLAETLKQFLVGEQVSLELAGQDEGMVKVLSCQGRKAGDLTTLYAGGSITCPIARAMADQLDLSYGQMGRLLNHLNVKIRSCSLGCFG